MTIDDFQKKYGRGWLNKWKSYNDKWEHRRGDRTEWDLYKRQVKILTEQNAPHVDGIDKRSFNSWHLDHRISIWYGYNNNIPAEHIAHLDNLTMKEWISNIAKNTSNDVCEKNAWILG